MKILSGQTLVNFLRKNADKIQKRLWIVVPYIGGFNSVKRIIGVNWINNPAISFKLITDTSELNNFNSDTIKYFYENGEIKHILGLHAKIYILDDLCIITSANLTNTAFTKRVEIGVAIKDNINEIIKTFNDWWKIAEPVKSITIENIIKRTTQSREENEGEKLPNRNKLPKIETITTKIPSKFTNHQLLLEYYNEFANIYEENQRIYPEIPLFFETDCFLNYLFHGDDTPSKEYEKPDIELPKLTINQRKDKIIKYAIKFKKWILDGNDDINRYTNSSKLIKRYLNTNNIEKLNFEKFDEILSGINSINSVQRFKIKQKILTNNSIDVIIKGLKSLLHSDKHLSNRLFECNSIKFLGIASMNEIIGFYNPNNFPLMNKNSNCGLRFLGYEAPINE